MNLLELTVKELKIICRDKNVSCSGKKSYLIEKIQNPDKFKKGSICSKNGNEYEKQIFNITSQVRHVLSNLKFNTQNSNQLGGSNHKNDIECNLREHSDIPIEIKKCSTPDWMQSKIYFDNIHKEWKVTENGKIPDPCKRIFTLLLKESNTQDIFDGNVPVLKNITYDDWIKQKHLFKDKYIPCPDDTIANLYKEKGCFYIQISDKGLYHLGTDPCNFGVPYFSCPQKLRIRIKVHSRKNKNGFASLSPMLSCLPQNINLLKKSPYSLDKFESIPEQLIQC